MRRGFARNYLLPRGLAIIATPSYLKHLEDINRQRALQKEKKKEKANEYAARIEGLILKTFLPIGEEGSFGRITTGDIALLLKAEGIDIDKKCISLEEPLKSPGVYDIPIKLHPEIKTVLKLWVLAKEQE